MKHPTLLVGTLLCALTFTLTVVFADDSLIESILPSDTPVPEVPADILLENVDVSTLFPEIETPKETLEIIPTSTPTLPEETESITPSEIVIQDTPTTTVPVIETSPETQKITVPVPREEQPIPIESPLSQQESIMRCARGMWEESGYDNMGACVRATRE